jgi:hypothetical protein
MRLRPLHLSALALVALLSACGGNSTDTPAGPSRSAEAEPNGTIAQANAVSLDAVVTGTISAADDLDYFKLTVPAGGASVRFQTFDSTGKSCDPTGMAVDPMIAVFDSAGALLTGADDNGLAPFCEDLSVSLPAGVAYVMVAGNAPFPFAYTLQVSSP